jgi:DNA-binding GntR family transcriptional regulator
MHHSAGRSSPVSKRREVVKTHRLLTERISEGTVDRCQQLATVHLRTAQHYVLSEEDADARVDVSKFPMSWRHIG